MTTIIKKAETFRRTLKFSDKNTGAPIDLTGCTAQSQMRTKPGGTLLADAVCTVADGMVTALWDKTTTSAFTEGKAGYDIWLICDGEQKPIFTEEVEIIKAYTEVE